MSNRLPVDRQVDTDGNATWRTSPGGLVTAMEPIMRATQGAWIGWAGVEDFETAPFQNDGITIVTVPLSAEEIRDYYEGFSNDTLWPLYHDVIAPPTYHREWWDAYVAVNQRFAKAAANVAAATATVWVQDYQLQLVPAMLRALRPDLVIGFFNHIPFPAYGIFSQLPWRRQIIEGLLGADLIGFQRAADAGNFTRAVRRLFGYTTKGSQIDVPGAIGEPRTVVAGHFPISIDANSYEELARRPDIQERAKEIRRELGDPDVLMLGVDRLDYTKGISHRLKAFGELLTDGSLPSGEAVLVQVASPSRERVETYRQLRDEIELMVGRINGDFGSLRYSPISYLHHGYPREEMVALYLAADVMLVTALRDGMNLVAKEYVATRFDNGGVLVLSEFAGASDELRQALLINPHDIDGLKNTILRAMKMTPKERTRRMRSLRKRVLDYDVARWSSLFLDRLAKAAGTRGARATALVEVTALPAAASSHVPAALRAALRKIAATPQLLIALDFDGTLAPLVDKPEDARALPEARAAVLRLLEMPGTRVALVSGRAVDSLAQVADMSEHALLVGSHGAEIGYDSRDMSMQLTEEERHNRERLGLILADVAGQWDKVWLEEKPAGVALHSRLATPDDSRAAFSLALGKTQGVIEGLTIREGKNVLEFSVRSATKGDAVAHLREHTQASAVFYAGDDVTDEDVFATLGPDDFGLKSGPGTTHAAYRVHSPIEVARVLTLLADLRQEATRSPSA